MLTKNNEFIDLLKSLSQNPPPGKIPFYSVELGGYDCPAEPLATGEFIFYLFSDRMPTGKTKWNHIDVSGLNIEPLKLARIIKVGAHILFPNQEKVFYQDASFSHGQRFEKLMIDFQFERMLVFKHPDRKNVKEEVNACIKFGKESPELLERMDGACDLNFYFNDNSLFATGFLGRNTCDPGVCLAMDDWLNFVINLSRRDQISLPYVLRRHKINPTVINLNIYRNIYLTPRLHNDAGYILRVKWYLSKFLYFFGRFGV